MIGMLPTTATVGGQELNIRTDYRTILNMLVAFNDGELNVREKWYVALTLFYKEPEKIADDCIEEAMKQINWFISMGKEEDKNPPSKALYDWEQDEQLIFSAINKVANTEVRAIPYLHWWSFMGYFNEIGEGTFSTVVAIRDKKNRGKKLEKYEEDFCKKNPTLVKIKKKLTEEDKNFLNEIDKIMRGV